MWIGVRGMKHLVNWIKGEIRKVLEEGCWGVSVAVGHCYFSSKMVLWLRRGKNYGWVWQMVCIGLYTHQQTPALLPRGQWEGGQDGEEHTLGTYSGWSQTKLWDNNGVRNGKNKDRYKNMVFKMRGDRVGEVWHCGVVLQNADLVGAGFMALSLINWSSRPREKKSAQQWILKFSSGSHPSTLPPLVAVFLYKDHGPDL